MDIEVIWGKRKQENFFNEDWTGEITLIPQANFSSARMPDLAC
jgi:hypothetical protein